MKIAWASIHRIPRTISANDDTRWGSLVPRPPPFFVLWFAFRIYTEAEDIGKVGWVEQGWAELVATSHDLRVWASGNEARGVSIWEWGSGCEHLGMRLGVWASGNEARGVSIWEWGSGCERLGMRLGVWASGNETRGVSVWEWDEVIHLLTSPRMWYRGMAALSASIPPSCLP